MRVALSVLTVCGLLLAGCSTPASEESVPPPRQTIPSSHMPMTVKPGFPVPPEEVTAVALSDAEVTGYWFVYAHGEHVDGGDFRVTLATYSDEAEAKACRDKLWALVEAGQTILSEDSNGANSAC